MLMPFPVRQAVGSCYALKKNSMHGPVAEPADLMIPQCGQMTARYPFLP